MEKGLIREGKWATKRGIQAAGTVKRNTKQSTAMRNNMRHVVETLRSSVVQFCQSVNHKKQIRGR